ncbi:zinc metallopeptidase [Beduini massiliensis]|uniref:zinc metallopeptidase n=1 Tax=Beduini massiliensis TaxID=1585974 RepID=UPI00059A8249|nr:zinc metallopeptidase [Beduini massiliensis]
MNYYMFGYLLLFIGAILTMGAQMKVQSAYGKYSKIPSSSGLTGYETARRILDQNGLQDVEINVVNGKLSDHYNPKNKTVNLSRDVYNGHSIASIAVAAHECGHAIQHQVGYRSLVYRNALVPLFNVSQWAGYIVLFIGFAMGELNIALLGIVLISAILLFQLLTLPVEFNASSRALEILDTGMIPASEVGGASQMLSAAAMTYVAAVAASLLSILRLLLLVLGSSRRD